MNFVFGCFWKRWCCSPISVSQPGYSEGGRARRVFDQRYVDGAHRVCDLLDDEVVGLRVERREHVEPGLVRHDNVEEDHIRLRRARLEYGVACRSR